MALQKNVDLDYFAGHEGEGLEGFTQDTVATAYLGMVQPGSIAAETHTPGTWRNSATDENFGPTVKVVVLAFKPVWTERSSEPPFSTVGRYEVNGIEVKIDQPKPGQRGFAKMTNPLTGNKVEELFMYACLRPDAPEDGILYFSPTAGSMRTCKQWNTMIRSQRLPNGSIAPIFAYEWELELGVVNNPKNPKDQMTTFVRAIRGNIVSADLFTQQVQPQLSAAKNVALLAAPEED